METIVALATPAGNSGVAVIRLSGEKSKDILTSIIKENIDFKPRYMYLKKIYCDNIVDDALVVYFQAPNSYTGEDVVEIQSHGGYFLAQKIIEKCLQLGAIMATPGEFSKRAFINGKMSIDQAEGIMDIINAESTMQAEQASNLLQGSLKKQIENYQDELTDMLADIEAKIDYPEYEYTESETNNLINRMKDLKSELENLVQTSNNGLKIKNGVIVAIVGAPNVGKSSILNALTNSTKAIVTNIAGTTRDVVEAEYEYKGIIFRLFDTAGIHESSDIVEQIGINRAKETLSNADIVLLVSDKDNINNIKTSKPNIKVFNKSDIYVPTNKDEYLCVSAQTGENINELKEKIFETVIGKDNLNHGLYLTNIRHIQCIKEAIKLVEHTISIFNESTMDIISLEIKNAWLKLGEISGTTSSESIIDRIFRKFCLGK